MMSCGNGFLHSSLNLYRDTLLTDIVPFWLRNGIDRQYGGLCNVMDDAGAVLNHEKYIWSQGRALWTFSALYNRIEQRDEWLEAADHLFRFLARVGRDDQGRWLYRFDRDGQVIDKDISIFVDGFVLSGMTEYCKATGSDEALQIALETYEKVQDRINNPGSYAVAPYEIPQGMRYHAVAMIFSFFFYDLAVVVNRDDIRQRALQLADDILNVYYVAEKDAILEFVSETGEFVDSPEGRTCIPGHAIEGLWFCITIFEHAGDQQKIRKCCQLIKRHVEFAWDEELGGLQLARDIDGREPVFWNQADCKPWWVHVEALVATAYCYLHTKEEWCVEWHEKIQDFAFSHYPVTTGEWRQWLDREGNPMPSAALPVKDPFHLPRALIYLVEILSDRNS